MKCGSDGDNGAHESVNTSTSNVETPASPANATKKQFVKHLVVDSGAIITGVPLENLATVCNGEIVGTCPNLFSLSFSKINFRPYDYHIKTDLPTL